jgi:hypothetical protein
MPGDEELSPRVPPPVQIRAGPRHRKGPMAGGEPVKSRLGVVTSAPARPQSRDHPLLPGHKQSGSAKAEQVHENLELSRHLLSCSQADGGRFFGRAAQVGPTPQYHSSLNPKSLQLRMVFHPHQGGSDSHKGWIG